MVILKKSRTMSELQPTTESFCRWLVISASRCSIAFDLIIESFTSLVTVVM